MPLVQQKQPILSYHGDHLRFLVVLLLNILFSVQCFCEHCFLFVLFRLAIVLFILRLTVSDYPFGYLKLFILQPSERMRQKSSILQSTHILNDKYLICHSLTIHGSDDGHYMLSSVVYYCHNYTPHLIKHGNRFFSFTQKSTFHVTSRYKYCLDLDQPLTDQPIPF